MHRGFTIAISYFNYSLLTAFLSPWIFSETSFYKLFIEQMREMLSSAILHEKNNHGTNFFILFFSCYGYSIPSHDNAMTIFHLFNLQNKGYQKMRVVVIVLAIIAWKKLKQGQLF